MTSLIMAQRRPRRRRRGYGILERRAVVWAIRVCTFVGVILAWQLLTKDINRALFAPPSEIFAAFIRQATSSPSIWVPLFESLKAMGIGLLLGMAVAIPLGLLMGRVRALEYVLDPYVTFLWVIPGVALVPLVILWFGFGVEFQIVMVFESCLFPMLVNAAAGAKNVDADLVEGGRSFTASHWQIMRTIVIPASLPFVFAGVRIGFSAAWVGVVVAQMIGGSSGLGALVQDYAATFRTADMIVPILLIMAVGMIIHATTESLLVRLTPWH